MFGFAGLKTELQRITRNDTDGLGDEIHDRQDPTQESLYVMIRKMNSRLAVTKVL